MCSNMCTDTHIMSKNLDTFNIIFNLDISIISNYIHIVKQISFGHKKIVSIELMEWSVKVYSDTCWGGSLHTHNIIYIL